jgi:hypothetical protein
MSAVGALQAARAAGIELALDGEDLALSAAWAPPAAVLDAVSRHKAGIVALIRPDRDGWSGADWQVYFDERAGIAEFDGRLPRTEAEACAFECCIAEWLNRNAVRSPPGHCLGCGGSDDAIDELQPYGIEPTGPAWLHPRCWAAWYANRRAKAVAVLSLTLGGGLMGKRNRPSLGRSRAARGLDQFDTPPIALDPLFQHEPLLADGTTVAEPFCGKGNLVTTMRARDLIVHASDIQDRGCPDSTVIDFLAMTCRPPDCDVLISNPPYGEAMDYLEQAWVLGFRLIAFLLPPSFLHSIDRFERMHKRGHLRRVHVLAERLQGMHDANFTGKKASQSQLHAWFVFDRAYCGPATINPVSLHRPATRMPWRTSFCEQCRELPALWHAPRVSTY